jgi:hypothetical protein
MGVNAESAALTPITITFAGHSVVATPILRNGAPITVRNNKRDLKPSGQWFSIMHPVENVVCCVCCEVVQDYVPGLVAARKILSNGALAPLTRCTLAYARPDPDDPADHSKCKGTFNVPIEEDPSKQTVRWALDVGGDDRINLYKNKGYWYATPANLIQVLNQADENEKAFLSKKQRMDPLAVMALLSNEIRGMAMMGFKATKEVQDAVTALAAQVSAIPTATGKGK